MKKSYTLFNRLYHYKSIELFLNSTVRSSAANAVAMLFVVLALYSYVPASVLVSWIILQALYLTVRQLFAKQLSYALKHQQEAVEFWLKMTALLIFLGAILWAAVIFIGAIYGTITQQLIILIALAGIISGSSATLSPIYSILLIFLYTILLGIIISFFLISTKTAYLVIIFSLIFGLIVHSAAFGLYKHITKSIELTEELKASKKELSLLNHTLEERVQSEVLKSHEHMTHMLHQSRLAQMGEMISMIAHQWRQPLSSITTAIASLKFKLALTDQLEKDFLENNINKIESYALHLSTTINDFRGFFKTHKEQELITFSEILNETLKLIDSSLVVHNINLDVDIKSDITFKSFPNELKQVILNIIKNSEDVLVDRNISNPFIKIIIDSTDNIVSLSIEDNAGGIEQSIINQIFDPYFTTKIYSDGTGLGLYMSKTIVQDHCKGKLHATNSEHGAIFTISLPRQEV